MERITTPPTVGIVIPVHNGGEKFKRCLEAVTRLDPPADDLLVVADGESDGSWAYAEEVGIRVVRLAQQAGPGNARNVGTTHLATDIVFFLDADVTVHPDAIRHVRRWLAAGSDFDAVFGSYDDTPGESNFLSQYRNLLHHYVHQEGSPDASTFWAGCGAVRREAFLAVGGFDAARYPLPSIEDIEFGYRMRRAGHRIRLCKELQATHLKHWGVRSMLRADFFQRALPWTRLIQEGGGFVNDLNLRLGARVSIILVFLFGAFFLSAWIWPWMLFASAACGGALLALNHPVYRFYQRKRGLGFAVAVIPWHWLYFFYSGVAFALGSLQVRMARLIGR